MLYKRFITLAAGCLLFLVAFIIYSELSHKSMEDQFRAEREKYHMDRVALTSADIGSSSSSPSLPAPTADASANTNTLIGPVPPPSTPGDSSDTNAAPASTPADTNAAPAPMPSSTMDERSHPSFFQFASFRPGDTAAMANPAVAVLTQATTTAAPSMPVGIPSAAKATPSGNAGEGSVIVLLYHQFKPAGVKIPAMFQWTMNVDVFESEMKYIHDNGYNVISMADLLKFLHHQGSVPPRAVCITVDDGYKSAIVFAAPILKKYGYPWTFFIYPDFITTGEGPGAASWNDLTQLQSEGVDIECHSMTHPILTKHRQKIKDANGKSEVKNLDADEYAAFLKNETATAKALLEQHMGKPITCFAYPYGEYNKQVEQAVVDAGFDAIFTVADNPVHATTSLHSIGRYTITQGVEKNFAAYLRQGALGLSEADPAPGATTSNPRPVITAVLGFAGTLDPNSIETSVRDFGDVRHDFDPQTNTVRLYLPRDLIQPVVLVNIRVKDAASGQVMVANWHFNYEPAGGAGAAAHTPIGAAGATTNASTATESENAPKSAAGTPLDAHPAADASPH